MGILKSTTNLVANAKYKYKRFLSARYSSSIVRDVPATGGTALVQAWWYPPDLKPGGAYISSNSLMLAVEHVRNGFRDYSLISTEGGSFKVVQDNFPNFSMLRAENYYDVRASCNKWMLLRCKAVSGLPYELLWNPTTYEVRPLPLFAWPPIVRDGVRLYYGWRCWGIGFDPSSEEYKVIRFGHLEDYDNEDEAHAVLFSLKTGSWKVIPDHHFPNIEPFEKKHVHINGITYWIGSRLGSESRCLSGKDESPKDLAVVSFDFVNEKFPPLIPMIPKSDRPFNLSCFGIVEFDGSLAAIFCDSVGFEIWVWNTKWSLYSTYNFPPLDPDDDVCVESVLGLYNNDKALFQDSKGSLLLYDCHTRLLKGLGIRGSLKVYPYVQST